MKKGFTLIEMLAVVILLGLLALIGTMSVTNILRNNREKAYQTQLDNIKNGAKIWATKNMKLLPNNDKESISLTLLDLKKAGFVVEDLTNPKTETLFPNDLAITITKDNNSYKYQVIEDSGTSEETEYNASAPTIILKGLAVDNVLGIAGSASNYVEPGFIAFNKNGETLNAVSVTIKKGENVVSNIPLNIVGNYTITYEVIDNGLTTEVKRVVNVDF